MMRSIRVVIFWASLLALASANNVFGLAVGNRVKAISGIVVRTAPPSLLPIWTNSLGAHGTITGAAQSGSAGGYTGNWWPIHWDAGADGWCAESILDLAPSAGDVAQPNFASQHFTTANIFWQSGYAPVTTTPPTPPGCKLGSALGNCTWYAHGRLRELGYNTTQLNALSGDAYKWNTQAVANSILVDSIPLVGSIAQISSGAGHVAVVESINSDGTITVTESAYISDNPPPNSTWNFLWRHRTVFPSVFPNYIHVSRSTTTLLQLNSIPSSGVNVIVRQGGVEITRNNTPFVVNLSNPSVQLEAPATVGGNNFVRWQDSQGRTLSVNRVFDYAVWLNETWTAVYGQSQQLPNLTWCQPSGWSAPIVVSKTTGTTTDDVLTDSDNLYVDFAGINNGTVSVPAGSGVTALYIDDVFKAWFDTPQRDPSVITPRFDYSIGKLQAGNHRIKVVFNYLGLLAESDMTDNQYVKLITVLGTGQQQPAMISPVSGSTLASSSATFQWSSGVGVNQYVLQIGKAFGGAEVYNQSAGQNPSATVDSLPVDGRTLYVRLWWQAGASAWQYSDYTYTEYLASYTITTSANPVGTTSGGGSGKTRGSTVTVTATAFSGYAFVNWTENGAQVSTNSSYQFTAIADRTLVANFALWEKIMVQANSSNCGRVLGGGSYASGSQIQLFAQPNMGWKFVKWSDGNTNNPRTITVPTGGASYTASVTNATMLVLLQAGNGGMAGLWTLGTNYLPQTWSPVTGPLGGGWVLRALNQNRVLLQQGNGGMIGLWDLNSNGTPVKWWSVSGALPGWIARDLDGNRILLQAGDGGMVGLWTLNANNTPATWSPLYGALPGWIARSLCGNRVLLQYGNGSPLGFWTLDGNNTVAAWTAIQVSGFILRSMTPNYILMQVGDGGMAGLWDLDANGQPTAWHAICGPMPGWILRGIDQP